MPEAEFVHPWPHVEYEFEITNARVVATLGHDGGAIVETVRRLFCSEGRIYSFETDEAGQMLHQLEYQFRFSGCNESEPYPSTAVPGRVVITGVHSNGHRLEIRGNGWVGYDGAGNIEGTFDKPPIMITEDCDPDEDEPDPEPRTVRHAHGFPMPPQFVQATVRVPANDWDEDD